MNKTHRALKPHFIYSGHHHHPHQEAMGSSQFRALNIITSPEIKARHGILPGWAWVARWNSQTETLEESGTWPTAVQ